MCGLLDMGCRELERTAIVVNEVPVATADDDDLGAGTFECIGIHRSQSGNVSLDMITVSLF